MPSGRRLGTHPSQHSLEEFRALFFISVRPGQKKGFTYTGHTLTLPSRDFFKVFLQVRIYSEGKTSVFLHRLILASDISEIAEKFG